MQTILIVDDAKENIVILARLLKKQANVHFATNGVDALAKAAALIPDLILLDISMPGMTGFEVLEQLKDNPHTREIPVIFVTGIPDTDTEEHGLSLGAVDYITKPFAPAVVQARVRIHLKLRRLTQELQHANTELTRMAMTDSLTGIFNRRHFLNAAGIELTRFQQLSNPAGMMMLDIDHFKKINDQYGHDTGDQVLVHTTVTCKKILRKDDIFGRIGGEEFTVLLPQTHLNETGLIAQRLCDLLSTAPVHTDAGAIHYTASFGVTQLKKEDSNCEQALKRADIALYKAKQKGRNQIVVLE